MASVAGSKIRLISKALIRYEGTLAKIDEVQNTVMLENVKVFGTEDRNAPTPVPATDSVYSQVVFKGADIKELLILNDSMLNDPAVLSAKEADKTIVKTHDAKPAAASPPKRSMFDDFSTSDSRVGGKKGGAGPFHKFEDRAGKDWGDHGKGYRDRGGYDRGYDRGYAPAMRGGKGNWDQGYNRGYGSGYKGGKGHERRYTQPMRRGGYKGGSRGGMHHRSRMDMGHTGKNFEMKNEESAKEFKQKLENDFDFSEVLKNTNNLNETEKGKDKAGEDAKLKPLYNKAKSFYDSAPPTEPEHKLTAKERQKYHDDDVDTFGREAVAGVERSFQRGRRMRKW